MIMSNKTYMTYVIPASETIESVVRQIEAVTTAVIVAIGFDIDAPNIVTFTLEDDGTPETNAPTPNNTDYTYYDDDYYEPPYESECNMCGRERSLNEHGYCSQCWVIWNS